MFAAMLPIIGCNWGLFRQMTDWQTFIYCWNQTILFWIHVNLHIICILSSFFCQSSTNNENQQFHPQHFGKYFQLLLSVTFKSRLILSIPQKMLHHLNFHFFPSSSPLIITQLPLYTEIKRLRLWKCQSYPAEDMMLKLIIPCCLFLLFSFLGYSEANFFVSTTTSSTTLSTAYICYDQSAAATFLIACSKKKKRKRQLRYKIKDLLRKNVVFVWIKENLA